MIILWYSVLQYTQSFLKEHDLLQITENPSNSGRSRGLFGSCDQNSTDETVQGCTIKDYNSFLSCSVSRKLASSPCLIHVVTPGGSRQVLGFREEVVPVSAEQEPPPEVTRAAKCITVCTQKSVKWNYHIENNSLSVMLYHLGFSRETEPEEGCPVRIPCSGEVSLCSLRPSPD